jgi:hypothetical protein
MAHVKRALALLRFIAKARDGLQKQEGKEGNEMTSTMNAMQKNLESRIDSAGWGVFFLMSGAMLLVPGLPAGSWLTGVGILLIGLSALRAMLGLPVSTFSVMMALVLVATGLGEAAGVAVPWFALMLVLCGVALVIGQLVSRPRVA